MGSGEPEGRLPFCGHTVSSAADAARVQEPVVFQVPHTVNMEQWTSLIVDAGLLSFNIPGALRSGKFSGLEIVSWAAAGKCTSQAMYMFCFQKQKQKHWQCTCLAFKGKSRNIDNA